MSSNSGPIPLLIRDLVAPRTLLTHCEYFPLPLVFISISFIADNKMFKHGGRIDVIEVQFGIDLFG